MEEFGGHLRKLAKSSRQYILCGDWNIAHKEIDLKNYKTSTKNSGFLTEERAWLDQVFGPVGLVDAFRVVNQEPGQYTWWSQRQPTTRERNVGWRLSIVTTNALSGSRPRDATISSAQLRAQSGPQGLRGTRAA
jgi:exodeoxyribonuclease-3